MILATMDGTIEAFKYDNSNLTFSSTIKFNIDYLSQGVNSNFYSQKKEVSCLLKSSDLVIVAFKGKSLVNVYSFDKTTSFDLGEEITQMHLLGNQDIVAFGNKSVFLLDKSFKMKDSTQIHTDTVSCTCISPDLSLVASLSKDKTLSLTAFSDKIEILYGIDMPSGTGFGLEFNPSRYQLLYAKDNLKLSILDLENKQEILEFPVQGGMRGLCWSYDGNSVVIGDSSGVIHYFNYI
jgi:WD40 repeat protein